MIRSRLGEHYERIIREDLLTLFNRTVNMSSLECSVVLHGAGMLSAETKYRAACILEILTGQRVSTGSCEVAQEDPLKRLISAEQQRDLDRVRGAALRQSMLAAAGKNKKGASGPAAKGKSPAISLTSDDLRKLGNGFKIRSVLYGVDMFHFLEKCREFYLPDVIVNSQPKEAGKKAATLPECGHPNELKHSYVTGHFERFSPARVSRRPLLPADNPLEATTSYLLRSSDLLKFPDIELFFESMGSLVSRDGPDDASTLHLILRPSLRVSKPAFPVERCEAGQIDHLKMMNYVLSHYFNMYMRRPRISGNPSLAQ